MAFEVEKFNINGVPIDVVDRDGRKLIGNVTEYVEAVDKKVNDVEQRVEDCFQSVSNGKRMIAEAITGKGIITSANDTFKVMADNIYAIPSKSEDIIVSMVGNGTARIILDNYVCKEE